MRNSALEELRIRRFVDIQEEMCFRAVWRWAILESKLLGWNEKKVGIKVMVRRKLGNESSEWSSIHDKK